MSVDTTARVLDPERLRVLTETGLLDSPSVAVLDRLTSLVTRVTGAPVALVSLVDAGRQFFVSAVGLPEPWRERRQTPLSHSFCQYVVSADAPLIISDARADELLCTNLAIPDIGVIAYAGFPLRSPEGRPLGSFCVIDTRPREWSQADLGVVADLAAAVESEIALRLSHTRLLRARKAEARTEQLREVQHAVATSLAEARSSTDAAARTVTAVAGELGWAHGEYWQLGDDEQTLTRIAARTAPGWDAADFSGGSGGFAAHVRATAVPTRVPEAAAPAEATGLGLPVRSGDRVLGVLVFHHDEPLGCDAELLSRLDSVGAHLGRFIERRRADAARRAFERVVSGIDDYVWTVEITPDGALQPVFGSANEAAVFGADLRATPLADLVDPRDAARFAEFRGTVLEGRPGNLEARFIGADGVTRWVWSRAVPRFEEGRVYVDGISTDVTERHRISEQRDELVALVTHELRSPITSIRGYLELVFDDEGSYSPSAEGFLRIVDRKAADLQRLTDDLLDLARLDAGEISVDTRPVSLARLLGDVITDLRPAAEAKHLTIDVVTDGPIVVCVDPARFRQVLTNVVSNAVKYTPDGGRVIARAGAADGVATVSVADTGIGIPADQYPRLFERFFRTSNAVQEGIKGTGLGLAITKAIVERHGGTIAAHPGEPCGTVFEITLPEASP
ncbi:ATP-binding protein [Cryptosporangium arvum]|uniref:histidine kinase n=1 Tax=Cryptosporangium arvum DSM 44712 TaxID=927661 RepID=A0A010ZM37_9ACTN|nr:ATP-binding protein [Cryptosporangium arvum]EXG79724.1 histidine kinase with GAF domain [Cryptosporangium arvum DSM 44712]